MPEITEFDCDVTWTELRTKHSGKIKLKKNDNGGLGIRVEENGAQRRGMSADGIQKNSDNNKLSGHGKTGSVLGKTHAQDIDIDVVVDCSQDPPILCISVHYANGGRIFLTMSEVYEISKECCDSFCAFVKQLQIPTKVAMGSFDDSKRYRSAFLALGSALREVGSALTDSKSEWRVEENGASALFASQVPGISVVLTGDEAQGLRLTCSLNLLDFKSAEK